MKRAVLFILLVSLSVPATGWAGRKNPKNCPQLVSRRGFMGTNAKIAGSMAALVISGGVFSFFAGRRPNPPAEQLVQPKPQPGSLEALYPNDPNVISDPTKEADFGPYAFSPESVKKWLTVDVMKDTIPLFGERKFPETSRWKSGKPLPRLMIVPEKHDCKKCIQKREATIELGRREKITNVIEGLSELEYANSPPGKKSNGIVPRGLNRGMEDAFPNAVSGIVVALPYISKMPHTQQELGSYYHAAGLVLGLFASIGGEVWKNSVKQRFLDRPEISSEFKKRISKIIDRLVDNEKSFELSEEFQKNFIDEIQGDLFMVTHQTEFATLALDQLRALLELSKTDSYSPYQLDLQRVESILTAIAAEDPESEDRAIAFALEWRERWMARNIVMAYLEATERGVDTAVIVGAIHAPRLMYRLQNFFKSIQLEGVPLVLDASFAFH